MIYFSVTIFTSAFLLFMVQPIIAKQILPWFGGSSAVWTTCMVFFQMILLLGYWYADFVVRKLNKRTQAIFQSTVVVVSLICLPIIASDAWKPTADTEPSTRILLLLLVTVGLPYLLLSTTGPLVQAWFARCYPQAKVYRLFALSNFASLLSLLAYPPLIEPHIDLHSQAWLWSGIYVVYAILIVVSAWHSNRHEVAPEIPRSTTSTAEVVVSAPSKQDYTLWLLLATLGSVLLLSFTNHITQNIASVPFLWIVPLVLYLVTFILVFDVGSSRGKSGWYSRPVFIPLLFALLVITTYGMYEGYASTMNIYLALPLFCILLFVACMFCHGELASLRPAAQYITQFYLCLSVGGAAGGLMVGLLAPLVFNSFAELPLALVSCGLLASYVLWRAPSSAITAKLNSSLITCAIVLTCAMAWLLWHESQTSEETILQHRDFYGTLRVSESDKNNTPESVRDLYHGVISHGWQHTYEPLRTKPVSYFGPDTGIARTITFYQQEEPSIRVGILGLGIGILTSYGREGDSFRIYELVPAVIDIAKQYFWYLTSSKSKIDYLVGDGRLSLEREQSNQFQMLSVDAFSSDSIPMHLMTVEALRGYKKQIREDGAIVYNVTNRLINLAPMVKLIAEKEGMQAILIANRPQDKTLYPTDFVVVTNNKKLIASLQKAQDYTPIETQPKLKAWTDSYNNLFDVLR
ncbi:MAG: fused MFS/spermidine synthase [Burkholderiales bacterium]|nr:fused MFS/spermidine synthase [Burkholderiales bacterium]